MNATAPSPWNAPKASLLPAEDTSAPLYAGFWRRWAASFIDGMILYAVTLPLIFLAGDALWVNLLYFALSWLYTALMHSSARQATVGKLAFGIKVSDLEGERISFARATGRYFATLLSWLILGIGFVMAAFTQRKQALHDMVAGTVVVRADASAESVREGSGTMKLSAGVWLCGIVLAIVPLLGILAAIAIPSYQGYIHRAKIAEALAVGTAARLAVSEHFELKGLMPASLEEAGFTQKPSPALARLEARFDPTRAVISVYPALPQAGGGAVIYTAVAGNPLSWTCSTDKIPAKMLPANCRN